MVTFELVDLQEQPTAVLRGAVPTADLPTFFHDAFSTVASSLAAHGLAPVGPPFGCYLSMPGEMVELVAGFPVVAPIEPDDRVEPFTLPSGRAVTVTHVGPFEQLSHTYDALMHHASATGLALGEVMWEIYLTDPTAQPDPEQWLTRIVWPLNATS